MNFKNSIDDINFSINEDFIKKCNIFVTILQKWGKVHNLSAELQSEKIEKNIYDSIYPLNFLEDFKSFADIGTGAGYPGLFLAIARPNVKAYLIEPRAKRVAFLNFVKNSLKLDNVEIICDRVEKITDINVDLITSRAVTNTSLLLNLTKNIAKNNTSYLFYKGSMLANELEEAKLYKYEIVNLNDRNYLYIKGLI